ncbi:MAG: hypothetical protein ACOVOV_06490, partial [Dolichospermum sp.]
GFYVNSNSSCTACPLFCATCTSATVCTSLINPIGNTITLVGGQPTLGVCDPGCYSCSQSNPMSCIQCIPGFYLSISSTNGLGVCVNCAAGCFYCSQTNPNTCTACFAGAYLTSSNTCQSCTSNCITCANLNPSVCTSCQSGYYLTTSGTCSNIASVSSASTNCGQNCGTCV